LDCNLFHLSAPDITKEVLHDVSRFESLAIFGTEEVVDFIAKLLPYCSSLSAFELTGDGSPTRALDSALRSLTKLTSLTLRTTVLDPQAFISFLPSSQVSLLP
jgi:hypothetical protein